MNNPRRNTFFQPALRQGWGMGGTGARGCRDCCLEPEIFFSPIICFQSLILLFPPFCKPILPRNKHVSVCQPLAQPTSHPLGISALNSRAWDLLTHPVCSSLHTFARAVPPPHRAFPCLLGLFRFCSSPVRVWLQEPVLQHLL